jgi:predicted HTH domain antitoxin
METKTFRFDRSLIEEFKRISREEGRTESEIVRDIATRGLREYRIEKAMGKYQRGELSQGAAAELAGVSTREFHGELMKRGLVLRMDPERLRRELEGI